MAKLAKIDGRTPKAGMIDLSDVRSVKGARILQGENVYIWRAESENGNGLHSRGVAALEGAQVHLHDLVPVRYSYTNEDLRPLRDDTGTDPASTLASKLYKYSLNGIRELDEAEVAHLETFF